MRADKDKDKKKKKKAQFFYAHVGAKESGSVIPSQRKGSEMDKSIPKKLKSLEILFWFNVRV